MLQLILFFSYNFTQKMKKIICIFVLLVTFVSFVNAEEPEESKHELAFSAGLNTNDAVAFDFSYRYSICSFVALGTGIGIYKQWYHEGVPSSDLKEKPEVTWSLDEDDQKIYKFYAEPFLALKSPMLFNVGKCKVHMELEPGLLLQIPRENVHVELVNAYTQEHSMKSISTSKGKWCFFDVKAMLRFSFDNEALSLGYSFSNLDIYTNYRYLSFGGVSFSEFYPKAKPTHTIFLRYSHRL